MASSLVMPPLIMDNRARRMRSIIHALMWDTTFNYTTLITPLFFLQIKVELLERFSFYERAKKAFAVVATG